MILAVDMATNGTGNTEPDITDVDFLVVGMGPAGASLACFLAQNGGYRDNTDEGIGC